MSSTVVQRIDLGAHAVPCGSDIGSALFSNWRQYGTVLNRELLDLSPYLILSDGAPTHMDTPPILFCGDKTLATTIMGADWASAPARARDAFPSDYRSVLKIGYQDCLMSRQCVCEYVTTDAFLRNVLADRLRYTRLVLPYVSETGQPVIVTYSAPVYPDARSGFSRSERSLSGHMTQNTMNAGPFGLAD